MDEIGLNELLQLIIREKGGSPNQYNQLMDYIAFHETGPNQRMDPSAKQEGGGPGRGLFQFEVGDKKGGNKAVNRTVNYLERNNQVVPEWLRKLWTGKKSVDVSKLNGDQQKMLFLGYHREHPTSNFSNLWSGQQTVDNFWLENHWAGLDDPSVKLDLFKKSMLAKDSIDALNIRKAELFGQDDKVPFQSAQKDPNRLPTELNILEGIFGTKDSSLIKEYDHGGKHYDFNKTNDYSGERLKDDWLWNNITKYGLQGAKWLGETAIPKSFEELMLMTGGGAAIGGIAKKAPQLLKNLKTNISPYAEQVRSFTHETDNLLSNLIRGNKWQSTAQRKAALESASDFTSKWHANPVTQQKLKDLGIQQRVNTAIEKGHHKTTIPTYKQWTQDYTMPGHEYGGWSRHKLQQMPKSGFAPENYVNPIRSRTRLPSETASIAVHEGGTHGIYPAHVDNIYEGKLGDIFQKGLVDKFGFLNKAVKPKNWDKLSKSKRAEWGSEGLNHYRYLSKPHEMHARINEIRFQYLVRPADKITTKQAAMILDDIKFNETSIDPAWAQLFKSPDAFKKMMNAAPAALPVALTQSKE